MTSERGKPARINRKATVRAGENVSAGKAPNKPGRYEMVVALTVEGTSENGGSGGSVGSVGGWSYTLDNLPGGPIRSSAVEGKTFSNPSWMNQGNQDLVDCEFTKEAFHSDQIAPNVRLIRPTIRDLTPLDVGGAGGSTFGLYINMGKKGELRHGFVIFGGEVLGLDATEFGEFKALDAAIIGVDFSGSPKIKRGVRFRHGAYGLVVGCEGLRRVTMRGHHHACVDCPDTQVDFLAGDLPGQFKEWWPMKQAGKGNYQRAEFCYAQDVAGVGVGAQMQAETPKGAFRCMVARGQKHKLLEQEGFAERDVSGFKELCGIW